MLARSPTRATSLRNPVEKSFTLGPALVAIGEAAAAAPSVDIAQYARDEMRALADEFGVQCMRQPDRSAPRS